MKQPRTPWDEFQGDLRAGLRAWRVAPLLPLISVLLILPGYIPRPWVWLGLPAGLFSIGWWGTERLWYLRIFRGQSVATRELWQVTWSFFWRFVRLGLLAAIAWSPVAVLVVVAMANGPEGTEEALSTSSVRIASAIVTIALYSVLTFVTPALAFTTKRVRTALRLGVRMVRAHWPTTAWYAVVPPLAAVLMLEVAAPWSLNLPGRVLVGAGGVLLNLWFKGATVAFYLRRVEVDGDGAAFAEARAIDSAGAS